MAVSNKPSATTFQVGQEVFLPYSNTSKEPTVAVVSATESVVTDVDNNNTGEQVNEYFFVGMGDFSMPESLVFVSEAALETYLDGLIDAL